MAENQRDIGVISVDERLTKRVREVGEEFNYQIGLWPNLDSYMDSDTECRLFIFQLKDTTEKQELSKEALELAQVISQQSPGSYLIAVTKKNLPRDDMIFLRKSGLNIVMTTTDLFETSKFEFVATQVLRAQFVAIKEADLIPNEAISFDLYHLMPMNRRFLKIVRNGGAVTGKKLEKMREVGEFYIHRDSLKSYTSYIKQYSVDSPGAHLRACRGQFMEFYKRYTELVGILTDPSQFISYEEGKKMLDDCNLMVKELAGSLSKVGEGEVWDVINNSVIGDFGSLERSTAIAAYVAYFGLKMKLPDIENVILAALIADLGLIYLPPKLTYKIRHNQIEKFNSEELASYKRYPFKSIEVILAQRLPLGPEVKEIVLKCHEKSDGSGFPTGSSSNAMSKSSQLLGFCWAFDQRTLLRMGQKRLDRETALKSFIEEETKTLKSFTPIFLLEMKRYFS